LQLLTRT